MYNLTGGRVQHSLHVVADDFQGDVSGRQWLGTILVFVIQLVARDDGFEVIIRALGAWATGPCGG